jgi:predicted  nucleic acid-binding Zn-ribbon protein
MHKCVRCGSVFEDNDNTILRGCTSCGGIFFVYTKDSKSKSLDTVKHELKKKDTTLEKELKKQIRKKKALAKKKGKPEKPPAKRTKKEVVTVGGKRYAIEDIFGIETVRVPKEGVYEINIDALMKDEPVIILERGKVYFIHLPDVFEKLSG